MSAMVLSTTEDPVEVVLDELRGGLSGSKLAVDVANALLPVGDSLHEGVGLVVGSSQGPRSAMLGIPHRRPDRSAVQFHGGDDPRRRFWNISR